MQETASNLNPAEAFPAEPIILNPGINEASREKPSKVGRGALSTLGVLLAGWFFGNLILLTVASAGIAVAAGSTGLVKVPLVTEKFFGVAVNTSTEADQEALENATEKINTISTLGRGETLKSIALDEDEINALFQNRISESGSFPIVEPKIDLGTDSFTLTGRLAETNAPVEIVGQVEVSGLVANVKIVSAKFGKIQIPNFIASNLLDSYLSQIDLSLSSSQLPAKSVKIGEDLLSLIEVSKVDNN